MASLTELAASSGPPVTKPSSPSIRKIDHRESHQPITNEDMEALRQQLAAETKRADAAEKRFHRAAKIGAQLRDEMYTKLESMADVLVSLATHVGQKDDVVRQTCADIIASARASAVTSPISLSSVQRRSVSAEQRRSESVSILDVSEVHPISRAVDLNDI